MLLVHALHLHVFMWRGKMTEKVVCVCVCVCVCVGVSMSVTYVTSTVYCRGYFSHGPRSDNVFDTEEIFFFVCK